VTRRITDLNDPDWQGLFTGLRSSWFRLETLQQYEVDYESDEYREFLQTGRLDREPGPWQQMISEHTRAGRKLQRVHVVQEPLTDYVRYEFAAYEHNQRAGEEIRLIPTPEEVWPHDLPRGQDFWLFDDADAWAMVYDEAGRFIAAEQVTAPEDIERCRRWRDVALRLSIPLADYTSRAA
jgi:hypothetical protein